MTAWIIPDDGMFAIEEAEYLMGEADVDKVNWTNMADNLYVYQMFYIMCLSNNDLKFKHIVLIYCIAPNLHAVYSVVGFFEVFKFHELLIFTIILLELYLAVLYIFIRVSISLKFVEFKYLKKPNHTVTIL